MVHPALWLTVELQFFRVVFRVCVFIQSTVFAQRLMSLESNIIATLSSFYYFLGVQKVKAVEKHVRNKICFLLINVFLLIVIERRSILDNANPSWLIAWVASGAPF